MTKDNQPDGHTAGLEARPDYAGGEDLFWKVVVQDRPNICTAQMCSMEDALLYASAPDLLAFAVALDASWLEDFPDGPDGDYEERFLQPGEEHLDLWRQCRAALRRAQPEQSAQQGEG